MQELIDTRTLIKKVLVDVGEVLIRKNKAYGDSALNPLQVFSKSDPLEAIRVRIDDKLSRIARSGIGFDEEDTITDLIGYLVLLKVAMHEEQKCEKQRGEATEMDCAEDCGGSWNPTL
jgi:hypothetical protein